MFEGKVYTGEELKTHIDKVGLSAYRHRDCFDQLMGYLRGKDRKLLGLWGASGTGKTALIYQAIASLGRYTEMALLLCGADPAAEEAKVQAILLQDSCRYIFLDGAADHAQLPAFTSFLVQELVLAGKRVVLVGRSADALTQAGDGELAGRVTLLPTTYIPYREYYHLMKDGPNPTDPAALSFAQYLCFPGDLSEDKTGTAGPSGAAVKGQDGSADKTGAAAAGQDSAAEKQCAEQERLDADCLEVFAYKVLEPFTKVYAEELEKFAGFEEKYERALAQWQDHAELPLDSHRERFEITKPGPWRTRMFALAAKLVHAPEFAEFTDAEQKRLEELLDERICGVLQEYIVALDLMKDMAVSGPNMISKYISYDGGMFAIAMVNKRTRNAVVMEVFHTDQKEERQVRDLTDSLLCREFQDYYGAKIVGKLVLYDGPSGKAFGIRYANCADFLLRGAAFQDVTRKLLGLA